MEKVVEWLIDRLQQNSERLDAYYRGEGDLSVEEAIGLRGEQKALRETLAVAMPSSEGVPESVGI